MKNPVLANWIRFKQISDDEYIVFDLLNDKKDKADIYTVWFARQLDGKRSPYEIDKSLSRYEVDTLLDELEEKYVIRDKRFLSKYIWDVLITIWRPAITDGLRLFSFIINGLLVISFLPLLTFSIYYFLDNLYDLNTDYMLTGSFVGLFIGMVAHEFGHMFACLGYGGRVFEVGATLRFFIPGAYVLLNQSNIKKRMRRIQVSAAGVETNLLLTALFLISATKFESLSGFFLGATIQNVFLAFLNLTFITGFDGMAIMSELLGVEELVYKAKRITRSRIRKKLHKEDGITGNAVIAVCYILRAIQIALPLLLVLNVVGVVSCFI